MAHRSNRDHEPRKHLKRTGQRNHLVLDPRAAKQQVYEHLSRIRGRADEADSGKNPAYSCSMTAQVAPTAFRSAAACLSAASATFTKTGWKVALESRRTQPPGGERATPGLQPRLLLVVQRVFPPHALPVHLHAQIEQVEGHPEALGLRRLDDKSIP